MDFSWLPVPNDGIGLRSEGDRRLATCPWRLDVSVGGLIDTLETPFTQPFCSFSLVRDSLSLEVWQKVGIAVLFKEQTKPPAPTTVAGCGEREVPLTEDQIRLINGEPDKVNIYTGNITYVGASHIEYSFNSFTGCSAGSCIPT
jgi:hypothetical protein